MKVSGVVLLGRTFEEYCTYFQLKERDLGAERILDLGAGVSSFCAEGAARGYEIIAADPIYDLPAEAIAAKSRADLDDVLHQLPGVMHKYNWDFYRDPEALRSYRETARIRFLEDYTANPNRYVTASLPGTGFEDNQFSLVLVSYFLFLYDEQFDYEFHKRSILELARIAAREVRIYPLTNFNAEQSRFVERLVHERECAHLSFEIIPSGFAFLKNSNELLNIRKR